MVDQRSIKEIGGGDLPLGKGAIQKAGGKGAAQLLFDHPPHRSGAIPPIKPPPHRLGADIVGKLHINPLLLQPRSQLGEHQARDGEQLLLL